MFSYIVIYKNPDETSGLSLRIETNDLYKYNSNRFDVDIILLLFFSTIADVT